MRHQLGEVARMHGAGGEQACKVHDGFTHMKWTLGVRQVASVCPPGCLGFLPAWRSGTAPYLARLLASTWGVVRRHAKQKAHIS